MSDAVTDLPHLALSVRQPWAWAIVHAGKDLENRSWQAMNWGLNTRGRVAIHAAKTMSRAEYDDAFMFMLMRAHVECPEPAELLRGGIIGTVEIVDVVRESASVWFTGPRGLVLRDPQPCDFIPSVGALGFFAWTQADPSILPAPAKWMLDDDLPKRRARPAPAAAPVEPTDPNQLALFRD